MTNKLSCFTGGKQCQDPNDDEGTCVLLPDCPKIFELSTSTIIGLKDLNFVKLSQCGYFNRRRYVCCAPETVAITTTESSVMNLSRLTTPTTTTTTTEAAPRPPWLEKLYALLPVSPECGIVVEDFLFGPRETFGSYPWVALIEYDKGN